MDDSRRRSLKVVRVLCDGCERATANFYCTECKECACDSCAEQLHVRGRRSSKRSSARSCKGRHMKDLGRSVGVLPLCKTCRARPAYRFSTGEVHPICKDCRKTYSDKEKPKSAHDVVKRAIAEELGRSSRGSSTKGSSTKHRHKRGHASASEGDSTGDDSTHMSFSRESSAE